MRLLVGSIDNATASEALQHAAEGPLPSPGAVTRVVARAKTFTDQGWGNKKGRVYLCVERGEERVHTLDLFGLARDGPTTDVARAHEGLELAVAAGDKLVVRYRVGGGGGHRLVLEDFSVDVDVAVAGRGAPIRIGVDEVRDAAASDDLRHAAETTLAVGGVATRVVAEARVFTDQGWGNKKGRLYLCVERSGDRLHTVDLFGLAREAPESDVARTHDVDLAVAAGDTLVVRYRVGGGGGHSLTVEGLSVVVDVAAGRAATPRVEPPPQQHNATALAPPAHPPAGPSPPPRAGSPPTCVATAIAAEVADLLARGDVPAAVARAWDSYRASVRADPKRRAEHEASAINFSGHTMRYSASTIGEAPPRGRPLYIALHGGGGCPTATNDQQYEHMKVYYKASVKCGVYCAVRGITDDWNLHWRGESFPMYDRLVENMIAFADVDPDRVYVLGYSAGGDGTYRIANTMPDRWAAANMSAGHPNGVDCTNYAAVPFAIQLGENDEAYKRHRIAAEYGERIRALQADMTQAGVEGLYKHACFIHKGKGHGVQDHCPRNTPQTVVHGDDLRAWLDGKPCRYEERDTNAIAWLDKHTRTPQPPVVVWRMAAGWAASRAGDGMMATAERPRCFYHVSVDRYGEHRAWAAGQHPRRELPEGLCTTGLVRVACDRARNTTSVHTEGEGVHFLRVYLHPTLADPARDLEVVVNGRSLGRKAFPPADPEVLARTLVDRGDPRHGTPFVVTLSADTQGEWVSHHHRAG